MIVNPRSQGGQAGKDWPYLAERIRRSVAFDEALTRAPGDATRLAREALRGGAERVIALGGDGTINEVVNGFFEDGAPIAPHAAMGLVPYGTGGDFRKTVRVPKDLDDAVAILAADRRRTIDVGRLDLTTADGGRAVRMFVNIASFGMSGVVDRLVNKSKKRFGRLSFLAATTRGMLRYDNQRVRITFDGNAADALEMTINTVAVANGRYFGGGMHIAPRATIDDGLFDVVALELTAAQSLKNIGAVYGGTHLGRRGVWHTRGARVVAEPIVAGERVLLDVDGEAPGALPATFEVRAGVLSLRA
ncbi:MAG: diacylglycerol kinase family lipid kinase [Myxococcales bacterium]|nr:diacylglycerol kinase family lipid kinase [Myxococcales bacterium]